MPLATRHGGRRRVSRARLLAPCYLLTVFTWALLPAGTGVFGRTFFSILFGSERRQPTREELEKDISTLEESLHSVDLQPGEREVLTSSIQQNKLLRPVMMQLVALADVAMSDEDMVACATDLVATMNVQRRATLQSATVEMVPDLEIVASARQAGSESKQHAESLVAAGMPAEELDFHVCQLLLANRMSDLGVWDEGVMKACIESKQAIQQGGLGDHLGKLDARGMSISQVAEVLSLIVTQERKKQQLSEM